MMRPLVEGALERSGIQVTPIETVGIKYGSFH